MGRTRNKRHPRRRRIGVDILLLLHQANGDTGIQQETHTPFIRSHALCDVGRGGRGAHGLDNGKEVMFKRSE